MTKRIATMFLLLALAVGIYFMQGKAKGGAIPPTQTQTAKPTQTNTPEVCNVQTGIEGGTVNLRTCAGVSCTWLGYVTEGERLTVNTSGAWINVTTKNGVTGWLNSKYCKGK